MNINFFNKYKGSYSSRILAILLIFTILLLSIAAVSSASIYVSPTGSNSNNGNSSSPKLTIANAVNTASSGDDVILRSGTYNATGDYAITLSKSLTFTGENQVILDAQKKGNFFTVQPGVNATFINITFINGLEYQGAAIKNNGSITVINCVFRNNTANTGSGGGAIHSNGSMVVDNCTFINNYAGYSGGAIYNDGGDDNIIRDSIFINNSALQHGGAIDNVNGYNFTIINSTFINNVAVTTGGGAIYIHDFDGAIFTIINSTFTDNKAKTDGGAIYNLGNNTFIYDSIFTNNTGVRGGAIYNANINTTINNSTFTNNTATSLGGAIYNNGLNLNVNESDFTNNNQIAIYTMQPTINISNNDFKDNPGVLGIGFSSSSLIFSNNWINNSYNNDSNIIIVDGSHNVFMDGIFEGDGNSGAAIIFNGAYNTFLDTSISNFTDAGIIFNQNSSYNFFWNGLIENIRNTGSEGTGIKMYGAGNDVGSTNIINNDIGFINYGGSVSNSLSDNRIYNNTQGSFNYGSWFYANYNWWGQNDISNQFFDYGINTELDYWYVLRLSTQDITTIVNASESYPYATLVTLKYDLTLNDDSIECYPEYLPYFEVAVIFTNLTDGEVILYSSSGNDIRDFSYEVSVTVYNNETIYMLNALSDDEDIQLIINGIPEVNITIDKTANITDANVGESFFYTITVTNHGPDEATDVYVIDKLDPRLIFVSATDSDGVDTYDSLTGNWSIGTLAVDETRTLLIYVTVNGSGIIPNYATVYSNEDNINPDVEVSYNVTAHLFANLTLAKTVNVTSDSYVENGATVTYTLTVTNNGPDTATEVKVYDVLDKRLVFIGAFTEDGTYDNDTGLWDIGTLLDGEVATLNITVRVNASGVIPNFANITANESLVPNPNVTVEITVGPVVNVTISKIVNESTVNNGNYLNYTINVTNHGPDTALSINVTDILPEGLLFVSASSGGINDSNIITWTNIDLNPNQSIYLELIVQTILSGNFTNIATVTTEEHNLNDNNTATVDVTVLPMVNISINKTANATNVYDGDYVQYNITVTNTGPDDATGVIVTDLLDDIRLAFISSNDEENSYNFVSGIWNIGNLANDEIRTLIINVQIKGIGEIRNFASVESNENNTSDKTEDSWDIVSDPLVNLTIAKSVSHILVNIGDRVIYNLVVTNNGPSDATGVEVFDNLDPRLILENYECDGEYNESTGLWTVGNLNVGDSAELIMVVYINGTGNILNIATVDSNEPNINPNISVNVSVISNETDIYVPSDNNLTNDTDTSGHTDDEDTSTDIIDTNTTTHGKPHHDTDTDKQVNHTNKNTNNISYAGMKNTGLPIVALIILGIFTLFSFRRKK